MLGRLPIRARLTGGFALAMLVVIAVAAVVLYAFLREDLDDIVNTGLSSRSDDVAALIRRSGTGRTAAGGSRLTDSDETFVQVLTSDGRLVDGASRLRAPALRPDEARRAARATTTIERRVPGIDGAARMLARPVRTRGQTLVVVAGVSLTDRDEALSGLVTTLLVGGPIAVLVASAIGYLVATAGLRPMEAMRRRAMRVSLDHNGERLPLPHAHDEVRRLGETLNEMIARLQASFQRERRFVADASHELRTPLSVLKIELESALRTVAHDAEVRESLVAALEETDQMTQLADDLLLIARATDGRLPVRPEELDVGELLEHTRQRFADRAHEHGREIAVEVRGAPRARLDPLRGRQALGNLVDNALRHGTGDIRLSARQDGEAIEIEVSDEGSGFSGQLATRAFERFARGDGARSGGGAGLGLAIVRGIAEAHGGTATIVAAPERGGTVRLRFNGAAR